MKIVKQKNGSHFKLRSFFGKGKTKWTLKEQTIFFQTCSDLVQAGFSIKQIAIDLPTLFPQSSEKYHRLEQELLKGKNLSESLRHFIKPDIADQLWIAEQHGMLLLSLQQLARLFGYRQKQQERLKAVLLYPCMLIILLLFLLLAINYWLKPELANFETQPPKNNWLIWSVEIASILLILLVLQYFLRIRKAFSPKKQLFSWDWFCELPLLGRFFREYAAYYLAFNLGLMLKSGLDLQKICYLLNKFNQRSLLYQFSCCLKDNSLSGHPLTEIVEKRSFIPTEFRLFFSKGSTAEHLGEELLYFSETAYQRLLSKINQLIELLQPLLFLLIAAVIISTYLEILLPLYQNLGGNLDEN